MSTTKEALNAILRLETKLAKYEQKEREPIAIVGMGCRFPGADTLDAFWNLLVEGRDASGDIPSDRWDKDLFFDPDPAVSGKSNCKRGSFLADVRGFEPAFFEISPREAEAMDPQQRLLLEVAWEAIEDAGLRLRDMLRTAVFVGSCTFDYAYRLRGDHARVPESAKVFATSGSASSILANRLSYVFGFEGPSLTVDTACSSALVALDLACDSLRRREADIALSGAVNLMLASSSHVAVSQARMLAPDGRCKAFDARADGYGRGEGGGVLVLKRLSDAVANGDRIWATIRGTSVCHVGRAPGLTVPTTDAEAYVIQTALAKARIGVNEVQYVEAHGTGTVLGDPIEIEAISRVLRPDEGKVSIGSVKSNIGHLEGAAAMPGLIKTALALTRRTLPASLHFETPNPHIPFDDLPIQVQGQRGPWPRPDKPLIAGVSSFGFGGAIAHAVLAEAPPRPAHAPERGNEGALPLLLSAKTPAALSALATKYATFFAGESTEEPRDIAYTLSCRREHHPYRRAVVGTGPADWRKKLDAPGPVREPSSAPPSVTFVFPGQGSQWLGMGRKLSERFPPFKEHIARCSEVFKQFVDWSLEEQIWADEATTRIKEIDVVQPMLFAIQTGLAAVLASFGVVPAAVVGHSMGEVAAAFVSGALSLEDSARVICIRSKLLRKVRGRGGMAVVELTMAAAQEELGAFDGKLSVAASNGPQSTVVAGDGDALAALLDQLTRRNVFCRAVKVDVASHSSQVDSLKTDLLEQLRDLRPSPPKVKFASSALQKRDAKARFDADYWWTNLREPVHFYHRIDELLKDGNQTFVELSPHPVLTVSIDETIRGSNVPGTAVASVRRDVPEDECLMEALATLFSVGYEVDWTKCFETPGRVVSLPTYAWQRERYWIAESKASATSASSGWSLVHRHTTLGDQPGRHVLEVEIDVSDPAHAYLLDHRVQDQVWLPAAGYLEMVFEGAALAFGNDSGSVESVDFASPMVLSESESSILQLVFEPEQGGVRSFRLWSRLSTDDTGAWTEHAHGTLRLEASPSAVSEGPSLAEIQKRCQRGLDRSSLYQGWARSGIAYGRAFQGIEAAWAGDREGLARLAPISSLVEDPQRYVVHPTTLDAAFQAMSISRDGATKQRVTFVPAGVGKVRIFGKGPVAWSHTKLRSASEGEMSFDARLLDDEGRVVAEIDQLRVLPLGTPAEPADDHLFEVAWRTTPPAASVSTSAASTKERWLLLADAQEVAAGVHTWLSSQGATVLLVTRGSGFRKKSATEYEVDPLDADAMHRLAHDAFGAAVGATQVVSFWALDARTSADAPLTDDVLHRARDLTCKATLHLVRGLTRLGLTAPPRVTIVTRNCQAAMGSDDVLYPEQALAWGFGASVAHELTELRPTLIDISATTSSNELGAELVGSDRETRVALRDGERFVPRLVGRVATNVVSGGRRSVSVSDGEGYALEALVPSELASLTLRAAPVPQPERGQIVVRTHASALSIRDVLRAKRRREAHYGSDVAGVVHLVGEGVEGLGVGDEVVAVTRDGVAAFVTADARLVVKKPRTLSFEQAAAVAGPAFTAFYGLEIVGRLREGDRVLILSTNAGLDLAAASYAKHVGAEVHAVVTGDDERAAMQQLGIGHVYDVRDSWVDAVARATEGHGIDLVLHALSPRGSQPETLLAAGGRFVDVGSEWSVGDDRGDRSHAVASRANVSVSVIAADQLVGERPARAGALLAEVFRLVDKGIFPAVPSETRPVSRARDALALLASNRSRETFVLTAEERVDVHDPSRSGRIDPDKSYLVTGGLGGLGLVAATRLAKLGAKHIVLMGRREPSEFARRTMGQLRTEGVSVHVVRADVADMADVERAMSRLDGAPPVHGVVHAAGVLADATLTALDVEAIDSVLAPKTSGALALEGALPALGWRVYFASFAGVVGSVGQAHYAAANAFLDAYAHFQSASARPALSLDWGAWGDVGLAARADRLANVTEQGLIPFSAVEGADLFERALSSTQVQLVPIHIDRGRLSDRAGLSTLPLFSELVEAPIAREELTLKERLADARSDNERRTLIEDFLCAAVAQITRSSPADIARSVPFKQLGFDSLMTVTLKNALERDLQMSLSTSTLFAHPTVVRLAGYIAEKSGVLLGDAMTKSPAPTTVAEPTEGKGTDSDADSLDDLRKLVFG